MGWGEVVGHVLSAVFASSAGGGRGRSSSSSSKEEEEETSFAPHPLMRSILEYPHLLAIFRNNNFDLSSPQHSENKQAIFSLISRLNHSCLPNAQGNFNVNLPSNPSSSLSPPSSSPSSGLTSFGGQFTIHATHPIAPGTEITISYLPEHGALRASRQARLKDKYGFLCDCAACHPSSPRSIAGEEKRIAFQTRLHSFAAQQSKLADAGVSGKDEEGELDLTLEWLRFCESEGLAGREVATAWIAAAKLAVAVGRVGEARGYAEKGVRMEREAVGEDSEFYGETVKRVRGIFEGKK